MALGSNNPYSKVILVERASTPTVDESGEQVVFIPDSTHRVTRIDEDDNVVDIEAMQAVLTADPGTPSDGTAWFFDDGGTPATLFIKYRKAGTTYAFPIGTLV